MRMSGKLSLGAAILININIMLGSGIFINSVLLARQTEALSPLVYALVAILILPLIFAIAQLLQLHHDGGTFYHFGSLWHPYVGFLASWSYFIAKLASCALGIHICTTLLQQIIPMLQIIPTIPLDIAIILLFGLLNTLHLKLGGSIQMGFIVLKIVPIFFVFFTGLYLFNPVNFTQFNLWENIPATVPLVLFAFTGFEASCSLSRSIVDAEKNGPRATFISYGLVVTIVILYQTIMYGNLGQVLGTLPDFKWAFPALLDRMLPQQLYSQSMIAALLHIAIACSSLGAAYGIMFSNSWNLYTLAQHDHVTLKKFFLYTNKHAIPIFCILAEVILAIAYLLITQGQQVPLQQVSALGSSIAYILSVLSLLYVIYTTNQKKQFMPLLALMSCILLLSSFIASAIMNGVSLLLLVYLGLVVLGSGMYFWQKR